ncbi:MAG: glycine cleavage system protein GcvH [Planctomycetes bacterium]|jgi:glycine cleavage system H protein|nr:glycine cleavage system protein GcvH [Planctomycetota bacterium]
MSIPSGLLYSEQHEWIKLEGDVATVGISQHASEALGDLTFIDLPAVGKQLKQGDEACAIESCKAAASVYSPAGGKVVEVNEALANDPAILTNDCYGEGWIFKMKLDNAADLANLMDDKKYADLLGSL